MINILNFTELSSWKKKEKTKQESFWIEFLVTGKLVDVGIWVYRSIFLFGNKLAEKVLTEIRRCFQKLLNQKQRSKNCPREFWTCEDRNWFPRENIVNTQRLISGKGKDLSLKQTSWLSVNHGKKLLRWEEVTIRIVLGNCAWIRRRKSERIPQIPVGKSWEYSED